MQSKKLVFVTGKGGIGKTALTGALGAWSAAMGKNTLVVESGHRDQLAPLFGHPPVGHHETQIYGRLSCINLNSTENFREYMTKYLGQKRLYETVFSNKVVKSFFNTVPGFAEIILLGRLFYTCEIAPAAGKDSVFFDGYASGHFLSLMTTPDAILETKLGGPLIKETQRIKAFLADEHKVGVLYVMTAEPLVVSEALDFLPKLYAKSPAKLMGVIVNRSWRDISVSTGDGDANKFIATKRKLQEEAIDLLEQRWREMPPAIQSLPIVHAMDHGALPEPLSMAFAENWMRPLFGGAAIS